MVKSTGDTNTGRKQAAAGRGKAKTAAETNADLTRLMIERDTLRAELAKSERRVKTLEDANRDVAERLDTAIGTVKSLIARD